MSQIGMGVLINYLGGNEGTVNAYSAAIGKTIAEIELVKDIEVPHEWRTKNRVDEGLQFTFTDGSKLFLYDDGQSCCEHRYMTVDDNLGSFVGKNLAKIEEEAGPEESVGEYDECHEQMFVKITTDDGASITATTHNEHNGYYGGFSLTLVFEPA